MYKIIGADQQEYGPVTVDQIREWIAEGRANGATLVQPEGATDWTPLSSFPDFTDALNAQSPPPPSPATPLPPADPQSLVGYVRDRDYQVDIGQCLARSWELFKQHFGLLIGATVIFLVLVAALNQLIGLFTQDAINSLMSGNITPLPILTIFLWNLPEAAFSTIMTGGLYVLLLKLIRGETAVIGDVFEGFRSHLPQLALAGIVIQFFTVLGLLACIAPGIYLSVAWIFAVPLVVDRNLDFWSAMEVSRKVITQHWWIVFCLFLVVALVTLVGFLACCVGLFVAMPVGFGAIMYAYEDIFRGPGSSGS